jgi:hypothetical protein
VLIHRSAEGYNNAVTRSSEDAYRFVRHFTARGGASDPVVVIATYEALRRDPLKGQLLGCEWGAAILDEGQRIRNPTTEITTLCKQIRTVHRIIISGTPIQVTPPPTTSYCHQLLLYKQSLHIRKSQTLVNGHR